MIVISLTPKFSTFDYIQQQDYNNAKLINLDLNCSYTSKIVREAIARRSTCVISLFNNNYSNQHSLNSIHIADFENIDWSDILNGKSNASSYIVRKGKEQVCLHVDV